MSKHYLPLSSNTDHLSVDHYPLLCDQVLRVLGNVAHNGPGYCIQLTQAGLLSVLCATLKMADPDIVTLSLEVLHLLTASSPQVSPTHAHTK